MIKTKPDKEKGRSMKRTYQEIERIEAERKAQLASIEQEAAKIRSLISAIQKEATAAAEEDNMALYEAKQADLAAAEQKLRFYEIRSDKLKSTPVVDAEEIAGIWKSFADSYSKEMTRLHNQYEKQKEALCGLYEQMIDRQAEMLLLREKLGGYLALDDPSNLLKAYQLPCRSAANTTGGLLSMGGSNLKDPDALFAMSARLIAAGIGHNVFDDPVVRKFESTISGHTFAEYIHG